MSEERNNKPVEQLAPGDHVSDSRGVSEVVHVLPYRDGDDRQRYAVTLNPLGAGVPFVDRHSAGWRVWLADEAEVESWRAVARRRALVDALRKLADDIEQQELPVPTYRADFTILPGSRANVDRWAAHLGAAVRMHSDGFPVAGRESSVLAVKVIGDGNDPEPEPEMEPAEPEPIVIEPAVGAELAAKVQAEADALPAEQEHAHVGGTIAAAEALEPKPTGNTAECGCPFFQNPSLNDDPQVIHDTDCTDWWFTFGSGHVHPDSPSINAEGGESLADRYVVIRGTYVTARKVMLRHFGRMWCDQYASAQQAGVDRFGLTELERRHWPTPAATAEQAGVGA